MEILSYQYELVVPMRSRYIYVIVGQSFGQQAARFSLYAPVTVFVIRVVTYGNRDQPGVAISVFAINMLVIVAGLGLGIFALFSMRRYGSKGILGRAILGIAFNGLCVAAVLFLLLPPVFAARVKDSVVGHWKFRSDDKSKLKDGEISFNKDGTFQFSGTQEAVPFSIGGRWSFSPDRAIDVTIDHVDKGDPSAVGKSIGMGIVKEIDDQHMLLQIATGTESYDRIP